MMSTFIKEVPVSFLEDKSLSEEGRMLFRMYKLGKICVFVQFLQNGQPLVVDVGRKLTENYIFITSKSDCS